MIEVFCPKCGERLSAPDAAIGKGAKCASCGAGFLVHPLTNVIEYSTERAPGRALTRRPRFQRLKKAAVILTSIFVGMLVVEGLVWYVSRPATHTLVDRLAVVKHEIDELENRQVESLTTPGGNVRWTPTDQKMLQDFYVERKQIENELIDRGH